MTYFKGWKDGIIETVQGICTVLILMWLGAVVYEAYQAYTQPTVVESLSDTASDVVARGNELFKSLF